MGLLDRFKKEAGPDALTWEAVARARVVPGVAGAEAVDADTVLVTWTAHPGTTTLSLADVREVWSKASGFARIELMDEVVAGVAPPAEPTSTDEPAGDPMSSPLAGSPTPASTAPSAWARDRGRLRVLVGRPGAGSGAVRWSIAAGALEARAALDDADVGPSDLVAWGVTADDVRAAALEALAVTDPSLDPIGPGQPAWVPTIPTDHAPVWLAAPARLLASCGLRQGIVLAPTPTELVLVDPAATGLLASVLTGTKGIVEDAADVLLAAPLLATPDGVIEWVPDPEHPCAAVADELRAAT